VEMLPGDGTSSSIDVAPDVLGPSPCHFIVEIYFPHDLFTFASFILRPVPSARSSPPLPSI
jgi:hypothetical protein